MYIPTRPRVSIQNVPVCRFKKSTCHAHPRLARPPRAESIRRLSLPDESQARYTVVAAFMQVARSTMSPSGRSRRQARQTGRLQPAIRWNLRRLQSGYPMELRTVTLDDEDHDLDEVYELEDEFGQVATEKE